MLEIQEVHTQQVQARGNNGSNPFGFSLASTSPREFTARLSPVHAEWLLGKMHPMQRAISRDSVRVFAELMKNGQFVEGMHPGIYFDQEGFAVNARHRLTAQVMAKASLLWRIKIGASPEEIAALDQTRPRRIHQSINLLGGEPMNARAEAALRQCLRMARSEDGMIGGEARASAEDIRTAREYFGDDVTWAMKALPTNAGPASMAAALAFAHQVDASAIEEFTDIYCCTRLALGGASYRKNEPAITLARWMLAHGHRRAGGEHTKDVMFKTLAACRYHIDGKTMDRLIGAKVTEQSGASKSTHLAWFNSKRAALGLYAPEFD